MPLFRFFTEIFLTALLSQAVSAGYTLKYDSNSNGLADVITSVSGEYEVSYEIRGGIAKRLFFKRDTKKQITWAHYELVGQKYSLRYYYSTKDREFHNEINCNAKSSTTDDFFAISNVTETFVASNAKLDSTCNPPAKEKIRNALGSISRSEKSAFSDCLRVFHPDYARKWNKISSVVDRLKFSCSPDATPKGCFNIDLDSITISNTCLSKASDLQKTLEEELLHSIGIGDDKIIRCAQTHCPSREEFAECAGLKIKDLADGYGTLALLSTGSDTFQKNKDAGNSTVPATIANDQVTQLSFADLRVQRPETITTNSDPFSLPTERLAKLILGSEAQASPRANSPRLANNTAPVPAKSTAPAAFLTRTPASAGADGSSAKSVTAITAKQATGSENPNSIAVAANQKANSAELGAAKAGSSTIAATGANALTANSGGARGPASTGSTNGNAESLGKPGTLKLAGLPQKELVQVLDKNAYYIDYRSNLKDPNFIATLKRNSITIIDAKGNVYGAPQGNFRYADTGQRLIKNSQTNR